MRQYVADQLIESARDRGRIPASALTSTKLLQIANEELESYLAPLITGVQEDYYLSTAIYALTTLSDGALLDLVLDAPLYTVAGDRTTFRIPDRAAGGALREISFLSSDAQTVAVPRISLDDQEQATWGFTVSAQTVGYVNRIGRVGVDALRMTYSMTPSMLSAVASCAVVTDIVGTAISVGAPPAPTNPITGVPAAPVSFAGIEAFDFVKSSPGFEVVGIDRTGTYAAGVITLGIDPPAELEVGDYVCLPHYTPVPQCPTALWPVLAQAVAAIGLERIGQAEQAKAATAKRDAMAATVLPLLKNRVRGNPMSLTSRNNILRSTRRW